MSLPLLAAGVAIYLGARYLVRRRRNVVRLRSGGTVKLLSSVALLDGSDDDLLAVAYLSELPDPSPDDLRVEARGLLQAIGSRAEYATCRSALASVRRRGERRTERNPEEVTFTFLRRDAGPDWYAADASGSPP
jgi:hypothetical protein